MDNAYVSPITTGKRTLYEREKKIHRPTEFYVWKKKFDFDRNSFVCKKKKIVTDNNNIIIITSE